MSNPGDPLDRTVRFAELAWMWFEPGWALVVGYHLYVRARGGALRLALQPLPPFEVEEANREEMMKIFANLLSAIGVEGFS